MSEVKRYDMDNFRGGLVVHPDGDWYRKYDFDRVTAERDAALVSEQVSIGAVAHNQLVIKELQHRLTAADERADHDARVSAIAVEDVLLLQKRADVLEGLLRRVVESSVLSFEQDAPEALESLETDICAALKPAEPFQDEHVCTGCGSKGWTANCKDCVPY